MKTRNLHQKLGDPRIFGVLFLSGIILTVSISLSSIPRSHVYENFSRFISFPGLYDTTNWEVYKNKENQFTIKYPSNLMVEVVSSTKIKFFSLEAVADAIMPDSKEAQIQFENQYTLIYLQIYYESNYVSLRDSLSKIYDYRSINHEQTVFAAMNENLRFYGRGPKGSLVFEGTISEGFQKSVFYYFEGKVYEITLYGPGGSGGKYSDLAENVFDSMISSIVMY